MQSQTASRIFSEYEATFRSLASRMLDGFPRVRRWEETDDIVQEAMFRFHTAIQDLTPTSSIHLRRLIAVQIRRQLLDLSRRYARPSNQAANYESRHGEPDGCCKHVSLEEWCEFHQQVERLPKAVKEVFELSWYAELSQEEIAKELSVSVRQVQRHWRTARIILGQSICLNSLLGEER
ncbi:sigma-70 family RNA polymerase sigma factor [Stieleria sp. JC731]|uniref:sigma-70 family RNA polymerase sigma factor n=1 Tax=Pirellulaceae TaxID=2691357 RepID=UPI001E2ED48C|nr:sigma-70 family RNA polymerase sigma factor [Stieleria sp. JC731]MCC9601603.1 sigma-70 family RNA polymerase sigma factor [Stieleria sp. JC731]